MADVFSNLVFFSLYKGVVRISANVTGINFNRQQPNRSTISNSMKPNLNVTLARNETCQLFIEKMPISITMLGNEWCEKKSTSLHCPTDRIDEPLVFIPKLISVIGFRVKGKVM